MSNTAAAAIGVQHPLRRCTRCRHSKPLNEFSWRKDGRYDSWCNKCRNQASIKPPAPKDEPKDEPTQVCNVCNTTKPLSKFPTHGDGTPYFTCTKCTKAREQERRANAATRQCLKCKREHPIALYKTTEQSAKLRRICVYCRGEEPAPERAELPRPAQPEPAPPTSLRRSTTPAPDPVPAYLRSLGLTSWADQWERLPGRAPDIIDGCVRLLRFQLKEAEADELVRLAGNRR